MQLNKLITAVALGIALAAPPALSEETAKQGPLFGEYEAKGFLTDYANISTNEDDGAYRYRDPTADFGKYNKLLVDRIKIWFKDDSEYKGIDADELKQLTDYFYKAIEEAV